MLRTVEYSQVRTFKATVTAHRGHYLQKVVTYRRQIKDAFKGQMRTFLTVFIPKLSVGYPHPSIFLSIKNGNGSVLIRAKSPQELGNLFEELAFCCRSDKMLDGWERLTDISQKIISGQDYLLDSDLLEVEI